MVQYIETLHRARDQGLDHGRYNAQTRLLPHGWGKLKGKLKLSVQCPARGRGIFSHFALIPYLSRIALLEALRRLAVIPAADVCRAQRISLSVIGQTSENFLAVQPDVVHCQLITWAGHFSEDRRGLRGRW